MENGYDFSKYQEQAWDSVVASLLVVGMMANAFTPALDVANEYLDRLIRKHVAIPVASKVSRLFA